MPTPTIPDGKLFFNATLYTGTGASLAVANGVAGQSFQPDFVWVKGRSGATDHALYDSVRGVQNQLESNNTDAETAEATGLTAFGSNGFTVGALAQINTSAATYVGWQWKAGGAAVSNTDGTITSSVSANTTSGFSVVTYTGTGSNATVGHGLGAAPQMVIVKTRSLSGENWNCWHTSLGGNTYRILLNTTAAVDTGSPTIWSSGGINPTSTTFTVGTNSGTNGSGATYVAYCWAEIAGYSAFGSYTGNGSTDGTFLYLGFRPRFVLIKSTGAQDWVMLDSSRAPTNVAGNYLRPNSSGAENGGSTPTTSTNEDFLSNGIKFRNDASSSGYTNGSGVTYIYMAFAENPFKYANAR
jgi:hypothetical protein